MQGRTYSKGNDELRCGDIEELGKYYTDNLNILLKSNAFAGVALVFTTEGASALSTHGRAPTCTIISPIFVAPSRVIPV